ncbi:site-specific DNA-cytosine methylase [Psychrobacillus phage Perkons]|nr:site-specific DNA-cytosine methylase [Psychrobacillus phage Perkons]
MNKLKVLSLFSGIGAFEKGLFNLDIDYDLVGFSEIDKYAIDAYCTLHNVPMSKLLGNVTKVDGKTLSEIDLITHGSPCQSFTRAGKMEGGDEGSGTESSLMWETVRVINEVLPKYVIWENVPDVLSKKHIHNFNKYINELDVIGYNSYHEILNANDYGSPQKRRRLFVVSIRKDINDTFEFPNKIQYDKSITDYFDVTDKCDYNVPLHIVDEIVLDNSEDGSYMIKNATKQGYLLANDNDSIDFSFPKSKVRRGRVQYNRSQTLTCSKAIGTVQNGKFRYYSPSEYWKLQGFSIHDYNKVKALGLSDAQLYKQAGNSIEVGVAEQILRNLLLK